MMTAKKTIEEYLDAFFVERLDFQVIRNMLTDDFRFSGPLMSANSADEFIEKLRGFGENIEMQADIQLIWANGVTVVARYDFIMPAATVPATEWYVVRDGKICSMQLICDPRPFFEQP